MAGQGKAEFVYVIYIRTTAEKLWRALIEPEFTKQYWAQCWQESDWEKGAAWRIMKPDGAVADSGEVLEVEPMKRLVLSWRNEFRPELTVEGHSRLTYQLEQQGDMVKLMLTHEMPHIPSGQSKLIDAVSSGWPAILSSLKSLLETGDALEATKRWPKEMK
jgi:uncharacterized protein YndB with AHSA1/START domain